MRTSIRLIVATALSVVWCGFASARADCSNNQTPVADAGSGSISEEAGVTIVFSGTASSDSDGLVESYRWEFGDGEWLDWTSQSWTTHAFAGPGTYLVSLWVRDNCRAESSMADIVIVNILDPCSRNQIPVSFAGPDFEILAGESTTLNGLASFDPDGIISAYWWNFGDDQFTGWTLDGVVEHIYITPGLYVVTLWVKDNCDVFSLPESLLLTVTDQHDCTDNLSPIADAGADLLSYVAEMIALDGSGSTDRDGAIQAFWWNFGDGQYTGWVLSSVAEHTYVAPGSYTPTLWVRDECGALSPPDFVQLVISEQPPPIGTCCGITSCQESIESQCAIGLWIEREKCISNTCPPMGACCSNSGTCATTSQMGCLIGVWIQDQPCIPNVCPQPGACCRSDGSCTVSLATACIDGAWTEGGACSPNPCPQPGRCCPGDGTCSFELQTICAGTWAEGGTCNANPCPAVPLVTAVGSRYLSVQGNLSGTEEPISLGVTSAALPCLDSYVTTEGLLTTLPVIQSAKQWGQVYVADHESIPATMYSVRAINDSFVSNEITITTWRWGDTNNDGVVNLDDILCELAAFSGNYSATCTLYSADQIGGFFNPDRVVNLDDILAVLNAFSGQPYSDTPICP